LSDSSNLLVRTDNVFIQLADAAAQEGIDFAANFWICWHFLSTSPTSCQDQQNLQRQYILSATATYQPDLLDHEALYKDELTAGHRVIVVAHSQGNLYVNQAYELVTASGGSDHFHVVAVATPAHHVAGAGPHLTLDGDVITLVPGSLPSNIANDPPSPCPTSPLLVNVACHDFDKSYMDVENGDHTRPAIVNAVLSFFPSASKEYAFVTTASLGVGSVWSYTVDETTGTLIPVINPLTGSPGFTAPADPGCVASPYSVAADPAGEFAFVASLAGPFPPCHGNVSAFSIDRATGVLTLVAGSPFPDGVQPVSVAVHPTGKFAYAGDEISGGLSAYSIDSTTGALSAILGPPLPAFGISSVVVDPTGRFLYVAGGSAVEGFRIDPSTGALALISSFPAGFGAHSVAVDPTGKFAYVANLSGSVSGYIIDATTGALTPVAGSPFTAALSAFSVAVDPSAKFVYVANANPSNSVSAYRVNPSTGVLTPVAGSPFPTEGGCAVSVKVDSSGKFVYVATLCDSNGISAYTLDPSTGALTPLVGPPFPDGGGATSITLTGKTP
jgi:6-phosphogluconolactonase (cycloisomerase 2 family)